MTNLTTSGHWHYLFTILLTKNIVELAIMLGLYVENFGWSKEIYNMYKANDKLLPYNSANLAKGAKNW